MRYENPHRCFIYITDTDPPDYSLWATGWVTVQERTVDVEARFRLYGVEAFTLEQPRPYPIFNSTYEPQGDDPPAPVAATGNASGVIDGITYEFGANNTIVVTVSFSERDDNTVVGFRFRAPGLSWVQTDFVTVTESTHTFIIQGFLPGVLYTGQAAVEQDFSGAFVRTFQTDSVALRVTELPLSEEAPAPVEPPNIVVSELSFSSTDLNTVNVVGCLRNDGGGSPNLGDTPVSLSYISPTDVGATTVPVTVDVDGCFRAQTKVLFNPSRPVVPPAYRTFTATAGDARLDAVVYAPEQAISGHQAKFLRIDNVGGRSARLTLERNGGTVSSTSSFTVWRCVTETTSISNYALYGFEPEHTTTTTFTSSNDINTFSLDEEAGTVSRTACTQDTQFFNTISNRPFVYRVRRLPEQASGEVPTHTQTSNTIQLNDLTAGTRYRVEQLHLLMLRLWWLLSL